MASAVKRNAMYGNVAYDTGALPLRRGRRNPQLQELPLVRPRRGAKEQVRTRVKVNLRPKEEYSLLPAIGFLVAALMAVMVIMSYSQLNGIYAQTVQIRDQLTTLQSEEGRLRAQYEEVFDQGTLQAAVDSAGDQLSEARSDQKIYVDLSEPDNAVVYHQEGGNHLLESLGELWSSLTA